VSEAFLRAYLLGYMFWLGVALGSLALVMLHDLTGGAWGTAARRLAEPAAKTVPLFALLFLPIALNLRELYAWARPEVLAADEGIRHKALYLNAPFFLARAALYFAIWTALSILATRRPRDEAGAERRAGPGLILYGLTMTFASVDWLMSLDPHWYSTIFGLWIMVGQVLAAFAFAIALGARGRAFPTEAMHDLGKLLFAFVMVWAYLGLSQWLITWSGNLPEEIPWYIRRLEGGWQWVALAIIVFHFALPFAILLSRGTKRNPGALWKVAAFLLAMRLVDLYWIIVPASHAGPRAFDPKLVEPALPLAIGVVWLIAFRRVSGSTVRT
jgi:hypothetical protein